MRSEFKSATQIYVNPIHFEIQLILGNDLFSHTRTYDQNQWNRKNCPKFYPDNQNQWNRKNCPKFFHRVIFALWIQICNPNLCKSHIFWITANIEKWSFFAYQDLMTKSMKSAFWIQTATQIYVSPIFFELQPILRCDLLLHTRTWWPKSMKSKKLPEILS